MSVSMEGILERIRCYEQRRLRRWILGLFVIWLCLWIGGIGRMVVRAENPEEYTAEEIESFAELYPIGP
jgi:hypothetical protein